MLKRNKFIRTSRVQNGIFVYTTLMFFITITAVTLLAEILLKIGITQYSNPYLITIIVSIIIVQIFIWIIRNKGHKGLKLYLASKKCMKWHLKMYATYQLKLLL